MDTASDLDDLLSAVGIPMVMLDGELRLRRFSAAAARLGIGETDVGLPVSQVGRRMLVPDLDSVVKKAMETAVSTEREMRDELGRWFSVSARPYPRGGERGATGVIVTLADIDAVKRAGEAASAARDFARAIVDTIRQPLVVLGRDFRVSSANPSFYDTFGWKREEVEGRSILALGDGALDAPGVRELLEDARRGHGRGAEVQSRSGGRVFLMNAQRIEPGGGILVTLEDASERREMAESRYRRLFESSQDGVLLADADTGRIIDANPSAGNLLGVSSTRLVGRKLEECCMFQSGEPGLALLNQLQAGEKVHYDDFPLVNCEGARRRVEVLAHTYDEGGRRVLQVSLRDVTERRRAEEALRRSEEQLGQSQKMQAIGRIAGGVAHDFNNMLTAILGYCELALANRDQETMEHSITQIQKAAERASNLTRQLLAFGRQQAVQPRLMDLNQAIAGMSEMLRRLLPENVDVQFRLDPSTGLVLADPGQIEQTLVNLVLNARDAMPKGGRLELATMPVELNDTTGLGIIPVSPGRYALLEVGDTGVGMSPEVMSRIFEPFFTTKAKGMGTGLGLATLYTIVRQAGGTVAVESRPGEGTAFRIYLPSAEGQAALAPAREPRMDVSSRGETVLLAEDETAVRALVRQVLEGAGYRVIEAASGEEAARAAENHDGPIDLLLTDVVMPGINGPELADALQARRGETRVLYMSGHTEDVMVKKKVIDAGSSFLAKPFRPDELLRKVRETLGQEGVGAGPLGS